MKAILVFNLDDHSDREQFRVASHATDWYLVCLELDRELRDMSKYRNGGNVVESIRKILHESMDEHGVSLEDMS